jgi:hypothetical protein
MIADIARALGVAENANSYEVLDVTQDATDKEIKKKYNALALRWHPDKCSKTPEEQEFAKTVFQVVAKAYEDIKTHERRQLYNLLYRFSNFWQAQPKPKQNVTSLKELEAAITSHDEDAIIKGCQQLITAKISIPERTINLALAQDLSKQAIEAIVNAVTQTGEKVSEQVLLYLITNTTYYHPYGYTCLPKLLEAIKLTQGALTQESLKKAIEFNQEEYVIAISKELETLKQAVDEQCIINIIKIAKDERYLDPQKSILAVTNAVANSGIPISENVLINIFKQFQRYELKNGPLIDRIREILRDRKAISTKTLVVVFENWPEHILNICFDLVETGQPIDESFILKALEHCCDPNDSELINRVMKAVVDSGNSISEATLIGIVKYAKEWKLDKQAIGEMVAEALKWIEQTNGLLSIRKGGAAYAGPAIRESWDFFGKEGVKPYINSIIGIINQRESARKNPYAMSQFHPRATPEIVAVPPSKKPAVDPSPLAAADGRAAVSNAFIQEAVEPIHQRAIPKEVSVTAFFSSGNNKPIKQNPEVPAPPISEKGLKK